MPLSLKEIHLLEVREIYPSAIEALEERLLQNPLEGETVTRLGFNLWYATHEQARLRLPLPTEKYKARFMDLLNEYRPQMDADADFCWAFGLGISLFWFEFPGADENMGHELIERAKDLDSFYLRMNQEEMRERFQGRGIFASYYAIGRKCS